MLSFYLNFSLSAAWFAQNDSIDCRIYFTVQIDMDGLGFIDADEFCSYLLQQLKEKDSLLNMLTLPFNDPPKFRHALLSKETICRLCLASNPSRYLSVSKVKLRRTV